jgi:hypothetical protein
MRNILILSLFLISILSTSCGREGGKDASVSGLKRSNNESVKLVFKNYEHDFGKVVEGEKVGYIFTFGNTGTEDLVINSATTSCGCTVPKYDAKPIPPGGNGNLEVIFDTSGRNGTQSKTITVKSNASTPLIILKITAEVVPLINNK